MAVARCAARFHTCTGTQRPASTYLQASNTRSSSFYTGAVNNQLPQLVLRGPEEPAISYEGYDADLPEQAQSETVAVSETRSHSIMDAGIVDEDVRAIQEMREKQGIRRQEMDAGNGAGMASTSASQESRTQQRRQAAGAGQQLRAGNEIDLICESLAFGGQVRNHPTGFHWKPFPTLMCVWMSNRDDI